MEDLSDAVVQIPIEQISFYPNHPFKVRMDSSMTELAESIQQFGVLVPTLVRPMPDGYQMVAGHRRLKASELAGLTTVPCIIRSLSNDEATILMVDSNLQREQILPSEKAFAYKMKLDAMKRQGYRTDLTLSPSATKLDAACEIGKQAGESRDQVFRYIRLTKLIPEILDMVDNAILKEKDVLPMALRPAVEISYLTEAEQRDLLSLMEVEEATPSHAQAIQMRQFSEQGQLDANRIAEIMLEKKPNQVEQFKIPKQRISKFFAPGTSVQKMEDIKKVFDISQTNAKTVTPTVNRDERTVLKALITNPPVPLQTVDNLAHDMGAIYDHNKKTIFARRGMQASDLFKSAAAEIAQAEFAAADPNYRRSDHVFDAYCVSYLLAKKYGMDVKSFAFDRVPNDLQVAQPQEIRSRLHTIRNTASIISKRMYRALEQPKPPRPKEQER